MMTVWIVKRGMGWKNFCGMGMKLWGWDGENPWEQNRDGTKFVGMGTIYFTMSISTVEL